MANVRRNVFAVKSVVTIIDPKKISKYVVKRIAEESKKGLVVYLSTRLPTTEIIKRLDKTDVNYDNVHMIDATGSGLLQKKRVVRYVNSPSQLTEISVLIGVVLKSNIENPVTLIVDSLSTMSDYVNEELLVKFFHYILNKARLTNSSVEILVDKKDSEKSITKRVVQYCDEVLKVR